MTGVSSDLIWTFMVMPLLGMSISTGLALLVMKGFEWYLEHWYEADKE